MELPTQSRRPQRPPFLPTIGEHEEFLGEEDYQRTMSSSQLIKTSRSGSRSRNRISDGFAKLKRSEDDEERGPEEERPLLGRLLKLKSNKVYDELGLASGSAEPVKKRFGFRWKLPRRRVRIASQRVGSGPGPHRGGMQRRTAMSPLRLLRAVCNAYVRALNRFGNRYNQTVWYSVGARPM